MSNNLIKRASQAEAGVALAIVLLLVLVIAGMITATLLASRTNAVATGAFRVESESIMVANGGLQRVVDWFSTSYTQLPVANLSLYDLTVSPVTFGGKPVVLSTYPGITSNVPNLLSTSSSSFTTLFTNPQLKDMSNELQGTYIAKATLLSVQRVTLDENPSTIERWQVQVKSAKQFIGSPNNELTAIIELGAKPDDLFAIASGNSMSLSSGAETTTIDTRGNNFTSPGDAAVQTSVNAASTMCNCSNGASLSIQNTTVDGLIYSATNNFSFQGNSSSPSTVTMRAPVKLPTPVVFNPTGALGDLDIKNSTVILPPGTYDYNSIQLQNANSELIITSPAVINIKNQLHIKANAKAKVIGNEVVRINIGQQFQADSNAVFNIDNATGKIRPPSTMIVTIGNSLTNGQFQLQSNAGVSALVTVQNGQAQLASNSELIGFVRALDPNSGQVQVSSGARVVFDLDSTRKMLTKSRYRVLSWTKNNTF